MKHKLLPILFLTATVVLTVVCYLILPDYVVMQVTLDGGSGTTLPKIAAVLLSAVLGAVGAVMQFSGAENRSRGVVVSAVSLVIFAASLLMNL